MKTVITGAASAALLILGLAACDPAPAPDNSANAAVPAESPVAANIAAAPAAAAPAAAPAPLVLEGGGLRIGGSSPPRTVAFETPEAATLEAVSAAMGGPPTDRGTLEECGGGGLEYAAWKDKITVYFEEDRFTGWDTDGGLKTAGGIGIGSSRADVAALPGFEVEESTLGTEFRAAGLTGILESKAPNAKVTHLWSGTNCVFR